MAGVTLSDVRPVAPAPPTAPDPAPWSLRVAAVVLDSLLLGTCAWLAAPGVVAPTLWPGLGPLVPPAPDPVTGLRVVDWTWSSSWVLGVVVLAQLVLQGWTGASIGKRAVGVVVVDGASGRAIGVLRTLVRQLAHVVDAILLVGYARPVWHAQRRTFADSITGTLVLRTPWPVAWRLVPVRVARWVRAGAVVLCVLGVAGSVPWSSGGRTTAVHQGCAVDAGADVASAVLRADVYGSWETRLGVRRQIPLDPAPWTVEWTRADGSAWGDDVVVEVTVTALDGTEQGRTWHGASPNAMTGDGDGARLGEVRGVGARAGTFVVESTLVVDGTTTASCSTRVRLDPADLVVRPA